MKSAYITFYFTQMNAPSNHPTASRLASILTRLALAITAITGPTGCAAMNAVRVSTFGSPLEQRLAVLEQDEQAVKGSGISEEKKTEMLEKIALKKRILVTFWNYIKRSGEIDQGLRDAKTETQKGIFYEYSADIEDITKPPLRNLLTADEEIKLMEHPSALEKVKQIIEDENLKGKAKRDVEKEFRNVYEWTREGNFDLGSVKHIAHIERLIEKRKANIEEHEKWIKKASAPEASTRLQGELDHEKMLLQGLTTIADTLHARSKLTEARITAAELMHCKYDVKRNAMDRAQKMWDDFVFVKQQQ